jgi:hypothetical protein
MVWLQKVAVQAARWCVLGWSAHQHALPQRGSTDNVMYKLRGEVHLHQQSLLPLACGRTCAAAQDVAHLAACPAETIQLTVSSTII